LPQQAAAGVKHAMQTVKESAAMSESARPAPTQTRSEPSTTQAPHDDIDNTRHERADAVNASSGLTVTAQASPKMHEAKTRAGHALARAGDAVGRATQKAPEPMQNAVHATGLKVGPLLHRSTEKVAPLVRYGAEKVTPYRKHLLAAGTGLLAALFTARRRANRASTHDQGAA
jgi:hypothetical protein